MIKITDENVVRILQKQQNIWLNIEEKPDVLVGLQKEGLVDCQQEGFVTEVDKYARQSLMYKLRSGVTFQQVMDDILFIS